MLRRNCLYGRTPQQVSTRRGKGKLKRKKRNRKPQLRLLRIHLKRISQKVTSDIHVLDGFGLPGRVCEIRLLAPKFTHAARLTKPEFLSV